MSLQYQIPQYDEKSTYPNNSRLPISSAFLTLFGFPYYVLCLSVTHMPYTRFISPCQLPHVHKIFFRKNRRGVGVGIIKIKTREHTVQSFAKNKRKKSRKGIYTRRLSQLETEQWSWNLNIWSCIETSSLKSINQVWKEGWNCLKIKSYLCF